ncbi:hypothetical protein GTW93_22280 [Streptomyces sp. SID5789]|nr:hypothetical protein [Streptomyces sp. SID5789]
MTAREQGDDPVRLTQLLGAQHDAVVAEQTHAAHSRACPGGPRHDRGHRGAPRKTCWRPTPGAASFPVAVRQSEEVVPVNVSTWVLPSGVTVGR